MHAVIYNQSTVISGTPFFFITGADQIKKKICSVWFVDGWNQTQFPFTKKEYGKWELKIPPNADGSCPIGHNSKIKVRNWEGHIPKVKLKMFNNYLIQFRISRWWTVLGVINSKKTGTLKFSDTWIKIYSLHILIYVSMHECL